MGTIINSICIIHLILFQMKFVHLHVLKGIFFFVLFSFTDFYWNINRILSNESKCTNIIYTIGIAIIDFQSFFRAQFIHIGFVFTTISKKKKIRIFFERFSHGNTMDRINSNFYFYTKK